MPQNLTNPFVARPDRDWEMFCRGRRDDGPSWVDAAPAEEPDRSPAGWDWLADPDGDAPVALSPDHDEGGRGTATLAGHAADPPRVRHFQAKVVGVCYPNPDGSSRIGVVRAMRVRELVRLEHRPDNPVDPNAVAVLRLGDGRQLGYLRAVLAKEVVAAARRGTRYLALVSKITGVDGIGGGQAGVVLLVLILEGGATKAMARRYLLDLMNGAGSVG